MSRLSPTRLRPFLVILTAGAALALAACGDDDTTTTTAAASDSPTTSADSSANVATLEVEADPSGDIAFTTDSLTSDAGSVPVNFTNDSGIPHDVAFENSSGETVGETDVITSGSTSATVALEPGEYAFFCTITGHREAGMQGTLTVN